MRRNSGMVFLQAARFGCDVLCVNQSWRLVAHAEAVLSRNGPFLGQVFLSVDDRI